MPTFAHHGEGSAKSTGTDGSAGGKDKAATADSDAADTATSSKRAPDATDGEPVDWKSRYAAAVAQSRKWEDRAKENFEARNERDALAERLKGSDATIEDLRAQVAAFEHDRQVATWRQEAAGEHDVPADLLSGDTLEQVKAQAERLAAWRDSLAPAAASGPGAVKHMGNPGPPRPMSVAEQIAQATAAGDKQLVASLKALQLTQTPAQ